MKTLVLKFGGAAVATPERFASIAHIIEERKKIYPKIAVVVSAMGTTTDDLLRLATEVHPCPPRREVDMLISVGERISTALLAMALDLKMIQAISFTGSQSGIITSHEHADAKIVEVRPWRLLPHLDDGKVVIVAGFQGVSRKGEITTLGRGGSDTTAVALAVALNAAKVEFYKDVNAIYDVDPKHNPDAKALSSLSYEEAIEISEKGAKVLHSRCLYMANRNKLPLHVLSFHEAQRAKSLVEFDRLGTWVGEVERGLMENCVYEEELATESFSTA